MALEVGIETIEEAIELLRAASQDQNILEFVEGTEDFDPDLESWDSITSFSFGKWVDREIKALEQGHSEIGGPFLDAYGEINSEFQRLYAYIKYGTADIRNLTQEDLDYFYIRVQVKDGCSEYIDNAKELLEKLGAEALKKMSGKQVVVIVLGGALLASGCFGWHSFLEYRKEILIEETRSTERKAALDAVQHSSDGERELFKEVLGIMQKDSEASHRAMQTILDTQSQILRAASKAGPISVDGKSLSREEAKDLSRNPRRTFQQKVVEQEFRIVGGNTEDLIQTQIVIEDLANYSQIRVGFRDRLIDERKRSQVFEALRDRKTIWLRLSIKEIEGEAVSADILDVVAPPSEVTGSIKPPGKRLVRFKKKR